MFEIGIWAEWIGYALAVAMGFSLGLLGGGGSILTVPILVYAFKFPADVATGYSLFIVGATSLVGFSSYLRAKLVDVKTGLVFAAPTLVSVYLVRRLLMPAIPEVLFSVSGWSLTKNTFILVFFSLVMLLAAGSMIRPSSPKTVSVDGRTSHVLIAFLGIATGLITGLIGAGGGFIIIPVLVMLAGLDTKVAVGTSLMIIAINALTGFIGDLQTHDHMNWLFLMAFLSLAIGGLAIGILTSKRVNSATLKPLFGWFVLIVALGILLKEL